MATRIKDRKYDDLLREKWHRVAYPTMLFMDPRGEVLTKQGARTVAAFAKTRESCLAFIELRDNPKPGAEYARKLFFAELALGRLHFADAKKRAAKLEGLSDAEQKEIAIALVDLEYDGLAAKRFKLKDAFAPKLLAMKQAGRIPSGRRLLSFWSTLLRHADKTENAALYRESLAGFEGALGERKGRYGRTLERMRDRLAALEAKQ